MSGIDTEKLFRINQAKHVVQLMELEYKMREALKAKDLPEDLRAQLRYQIAIQSPRIRIAELTAHGLGAIREHTSNLRRLDGIE